MLIILSKLLQYFFIRIRSLSRDFTKSVKTIVLGIFMSVQACSDISFIILSTISEVKPLTELTL